MRKPKSLSAGRTRAALPAVLALTLAAPPLLQAGDWQPLGIVDVDAFPVDEQPRFHSRSKTIWRGPGGASLIWAQFKPRYDDMPPMDPLGPHYHLFHEWAYVLEGDFVIHEPVTPKQQHGALYQFVEGTWLDRPAYTLHGGVWEIGGMRPQNPCTLIIFEEGDGSVITIGPEGDHFKPDFPDSKPEPYDPDWEAVKQWNHPWIVHTAQQMEWEPDTTQEGRWVKWLADDDEAGFRARLIKAPPGWRSPASAEVRYHEQANRFIYVVYGDLMIQGYDENGELTRQVKAGEDWFIHQPPRALLSHGAGPATKNGAIWLEVIYARGITVGGGEIESPKTLR